MKHQNPTSLVIEHELSTFHDFISKILLQMDPGSACRFMEIFHKEMEKLQP